jgi:hypothetical protein
MKLVVIINRSFQKTLKAIVFFEYSTIHLLAQFISKDNSNSEAVLLESQNISNDMDEIIDII